MEREPRRCRKCQMEHCLPVLKAYQRPAANLQPCVFAIGSGSSSISTEMCWQCHEGLGRLREGHGGGAMCLWEGQCIVCPYVVDNEWLCCSRCSAMYQPLSFERRSLISAGHSHRHDLVFSTQVSPHSHKQFPACILSSPHPIYSCRTLFQTPSPTSRDCKIIGLAECIKACTQGRHDFIFTRFISESTNCFLKGAGPPRARCPSWSSSSNSHPSSPAWSFWVNLIN